MVPDKNKCFFQINCFFNIKFYIRFSLKNKATPQMRLIILAIALIIVSNSKTCCGASLEWSNESLLKRKLFSYLIFLY